jgi:hypothetical protein
MLNGSSRLLSFTKLYKYDENFVLVSLVLFNLSSCFFYVRFYFGFELLHRSLQFDADMEATGTFGHSNLQV